MNRTQGRFRSAVIWAFLMNWGLRGFSSCFVLILALFLGPSDFGLMGIAMAYILFVRMLLDQGLTSAVIRYRALDHAHLNAVFWLTLVVGLGLTVASWFIAPRWAMAQAVPDPELASVIRALALTIPLSALTVVQEAALRRRMDFKALAVRSNVSVVAGGVGGVVYALLGLGVWALVGQTIVFAVVSVLLMWRLGDFRPKASFSFAKLREIASFSSAVFLDTLGNFVNRQSDTVVMGLFFGPATVGLYQIGARLRDLVVTLMGRSLTAVSLPEFSRVQHDPPALRKRYLHVVSLAGLSTVPPLALLAAVGEPLVASLGGKWEPYAATAGAAVALLCLQSIVAPVVLFTTSLLQATGRAFTSAVFTWTGAGLSAISYVVAGFLLRDEPMTTQVLGIAGSRLLIVTLISTPAQLLFLRRVCGVPLCSTFGALWPALLGAGTAGVLAHLVTLIPALDEHHPVFKVILGSGVFALVAAPILLTLHPGAKRLARAVLARLIPERTTTPRSVGGRTGPSFAAAERK